MFEDLMLEDIEDNYDLEEVELSDAIMYVVDNHIDSVVQESCCNDSIFDTNDSTLFDVLANMIREGECGEELTICKPCDYDDGSISPHDWYNMYNWETQTRFSDTKYSDQPDNNECFIAANPEGCFKTNYGTSAYDSIFNA